MNKIKQTLSILESKKYIGPFNFDITEKLLNTYVRVYSCLGNTSNNKFEYTYARKLAGINLLKYKLQYFSYKEIKEGIVYIISNPVWPNVFKIGQTVDLNKRLNSLQTGDPYRAYKVESYEFVIDRRYSEKIILNSLKSDKTLGEWIDEETYTSIIKLVSNTQLYDLSGLEILTQNDNISMGRNFVVRVLV